MFSLGILGFLQALAAIATIWGVAHTADTTSTVVAYGAAGDLAPTAMEWMNSFGSIAVGIGGFVVTYLLKKKAYSGLLLAVVQELRTPEDPVAIRNLALALCDWLESRYANNTAQSSEIRTWFHEVLVQLRTIIATGPSTKPVDTTTIVKTVV